MAIWIIPSNPTNFSVEEEFEKIGKVNWFQNKTLVNLAIDDIVYIYLSTPIQEVRWKCIVKDVNFYLRDDDEDTHSKVCDEIYCWGACVDLRPVIEFSVHGKLAYSELKKHGLKSRLMESQK